MPEWLEAILLILALLVYLGLVSANIRKSYEIKYLNKEIDRLTGRVPSPRRATKDDVR
jgi:hypothetical protein